MSSTVGYGNAQAILVRHGLDPEMDVERLEAAIAARGWHVAVERVEGGYSGHRPRYRALATHSGERLPGQTRSVTRSTTGGTMQHVLITVLARVLEYEARTP